MSVTHSRTTLRLKPMLVVTLGLFSGGALAAQDTASITVTGKVLANTCTLDESASTLTPKLPDISDRDIKGAGKTGGETEVKIVLKDCGANVNSVEVEASGAKDAGNDTFAFKNISANDPASGVGLYFYQSVSGTDKFKPDGSIKKSYTITPSQNNTLTMRASYVGVSDTVTAGNFQATVTLTVNYK